jgi:hypothetical protein
MGAVAALGLGIVLFAGLGIMRAARKRAEQLRRQGAKADWLSSKAVKQRKAREAQRKKSAWS